MRWSYRLGTLFGFPIRMHMSLLIFLAFVLFSGGGLYGLILMLAVFGSVLLHELGHSVVARKLGLAIVDISLYPFGGMARMASAPKTSNDEIKVAAAGPVVSLLLAGGFALLGWLSASPLLAELARINLMLGVFNLLPALPMDGGRILRAYLAKRVGFYRATAQSARLARWLAGGLAVAGLVYSSWLLVLAIFLFVMALAEEGTAQARRFMGDPGYQDGPQAGRPVFDPFRRFSESMGFRPAGSRWEVFDPEQKPKGPSQADPGQRVYHDRNGNRVVIEWRD